MSYNGSGVYTLPGAQLVNGEIVSATENNSFRNDVAAALNVAWTRDGQSTATGNIPMGTHKFTGLAAGTGAGDSVRYEQLPSATNLLPVASGGTGSGTASDARTALGLAIGTDVQAYSAELQGATQGGINGMKNRIINGAMMIDQRNAGASVTPTNGQFLVDRWKATVTQASKFSAQQSSVAPAGFSNSLLVTSLSAYSLVAGDAFDVEQPVEGFNFYDMGWGAAGASTVTLSFWVRSSLTGTFGGALLNSAVNYSYPFSYTINAANTWEQKSVVIIGPTAGTWIGAANTTGVSVRFSLGAGATFSGAAGSWSANTYVSSTGATSVVGTSGATFYITGVQLEKGSTPTSFDYRPYGQELALCQRYYWKSPQTAPGEMFSVYQTNAGLLGTTNFPVTMRATPTMTYGYVTPYSGNTFYQVVTGATETWTLSANVVATNRVQLVYDNSKTGKVLGDAWTTYMTASAEL